MVHTASKRCGRYCMFARGAAESTWTGHVALVELALDSMGAQTAQDG